LEIDLQQVPYLDRSLAVTYSSGTWTEVDTFLGSGPSDRHYLVAVDADDHATVRFGDGANGIPPTGTLTFAYKTGGGAAGDIGPGALVSISSPVVDALGVPVTVAASNAEKASGGIDRETIAHAKLMAPRSLRASTRSIAREDFEVNAMKLPGVARA